MRINLTGDLGSRNVHTGFALSHGDGMATVAKEQMTGEQYQRVTEGLVRLLAEMGFGDSAQKVQEIAGDELRRFRGRLETELEQGIEQTATRHAALKTAPVVEVRGVDVP